LSKPIPLQYGRYYHIYNRGNNRENLFKEERNYRHFLKLYARYIEPVADIYAYYLLRNHFHVLVRIKTIREQEQVGIAAAEAPRVRNPSQQFSNLFNAYTKAINKAYQRTGSLFEHHFERIEVSSDRHLMRLVTYIHHNPQKHGLIADFRAWPHSSYQSLCSTLPTRLRRDTMLMWFGGLAEVEAAHRISDVDRRLAPLLLEDFEP
jgi:putative transposase